MVTRLRLGGRRRRGDNRHARLDASPPPLAPPVRYSHVANLPSVPEMRTAAGTVVSVADADDAEPRDVLGDEVDEGSIADFVLDPEAVFLVDSHGQGLGDRAVALVPDALQVFRSEAHGLEVDARAVRMKLVPDSGPPGDDPHNPRHQVLRRVVS